MKNVAASVRARLMNLSRASDRPFQEVLAERETAARARRIAELHALQSLQKEQDLERDCRF